MKNPFTKTKNAYVTMVMGKTIDMSSYYSQYTKTELKKLRGIVATRIDKDEDAVTRYEEELTALRQQLKDIDKNMSTRS